MNDKTHTDWIVDQGGPVLHLNNYNQIDYKAVLVKKTTTDTDIGTSAYPIPFDAEEYDIGGWHDNATNNTRLTVPSGISLIKLAASIKTDTSAGRCALYIHKNGSSFVGSPLVRLSAQGTVDGNISTPELVVSPGDYFELIIASTVSGRDILSSDHTWFFAKAIA